MKEGFVDFQPVSEQNITQKAVEEPLCC